MEKARFTLLCFCAVSQSLYSQIKNASFGDIRRAYEKKAIDDQSAMAEVKRFISKAKSESNYPKLIQGYRDGRQFDRDNKLKYADSALNTSLKHGTADDISRDYLSKGIIYYYYYKNYSKALGDYLEAYQYSRYSKDQYQNHKVLYHIGIVKSHLGMYSEALDNFKECLNFYGHHKSLVTDAVDQYNYERAYYNVLHQLAVINRYKKNFSASDSLMRLGYQSTYNNPDFALEHSYFLKCTGISDFDHGDYDDAQEHLQRSLPLLISQDDFAWVSAVYFYLGKVAFIKGDKKRGIRYFEKIDSIFNRHQFLEVEAYGGYRYLINYYRVSHNLQKQIYYTNQIVKADSIAKHDFPFLAERIHRDYDMSSLKDEKKKIEEAARKKTIAGYVLMTCFFTVMSFFIYRYKRERKIRRKYQTLQKKLNAGTGDHNPLCSIETHVVSSRKTSLTEQQTIDIKNKLDKFEIEKMFIKKGLTEKSTADLLGTNSHYLSVYINENKGMNFNRYLANLRINYITQLLNDHPKYLNYHMGHCSPAKFLQAFL